MKDIRNNIKANTYKLIHTNLLWVHILIPIAGSVVFAAYYSGSPWVEEDKILIYLQTLAMAFPIISAIVSTILYELDFRAGRFQYIGTVPYSKIIAHAGNIIPLLIMGLLSSLVAVVGFGVVIRIMGYVSIPLATYWKVAFLLFGANLSVYILQYILCYTLGKGISLGVGIVATLLSPLLYLGLGDGIWQYIPCSYGIRLSSYFILSVQKGGASRAAIEDYQSGSIVVIIITGLLIGLFLIWGHFWQGTRESDE